MISLNDTNRPSGYASFARAAASIAALALAHLIALYLLNYLSIYVVPARNTSFLWWLCYLVVGGYRAVLSCPLILPVLALKVAMVPMPVVIANSIVWGLGLHGVITWRRNARRVSIAGLASSQAG